MRKNYIQPISETMQVRLIGTICDASGTTSPSINVTSGTFGDENIIN